MSKMDNIADLLDISKIGQSKDFGLAEELLLEMIMPKNENSRLKKYLDDEDPVKSIYRMRDMLANPEYSGLIISNDSKNIVGLSLLTPDFGRNVAFEGLMYFISAGYSSSVGIVTGHGSIYKSPKNIISADLNVRFTLSEKPDFDLKLKTYNRDNNILKGTWTAKQADGRIVLNDNHKSLDNPLQRVSENLYFIESYKDLIKTVGELLYAGRESARNQNSL